MDKGHLEKKIDLSSYIKISSALNFGDFFSYFLTLATFFGIYLSFQIYVSGGIKWNMGKENRKKTDVFYGQSIQVLAEKCVVSLCSG